MREVIAYTRVSTQDQGNNGGGLQDQLSQIELFAERKGYHIRRTYRDVATGRRNDPVQGRPGLHGALEEARKHGLPLIVADISRITRKTEAMYKLVSNYKVEVIAVCVANKLDPISIAAEAHRAQLQRERISAHTKAALAERKARGVKLGNRVNLPEAQKRGVAASKDKADAFAHEIEPLLREIIDEGYKTLRAIAQQFNERDIRTRRGGKWHAKTVDNVLKRLPHVSLEPTQSEVGDQGDGAAPWGSW